MSDITRDYSFGGWLKTFRMERGLTMREMAKGNDVNAANYCKIETSKIAPPNSREKIAQLTKPLKLNETEMQMLISTAYSWHLSRLRQRFELLKGVE
jgi:transcriptional regulator with XRE-family HTH domain